MTILLKNNDWFGIWIVTLEEVGSKWQFRRTLVLNPALTRSKETSAETFFPRRKKLNKETLELSTEQVNL